MSSKFTPLKTWYVLRMVLALGLLSACRPGTTVVVPSTTSTAEPSIEETTNPSPAPTEPEMTPDSPVEALMTASPTSSEVSQPVESATAVPATPADGLIPEREPTARALCLVVSDSSEEVVARQELAAALAEIQEAHPDWETVMGSEEPIIETGCEVQLPNQELGRNAVVGPRSVSSPGQWHAVIIVLGEAEAEVLLGERPATVVAYEMMPLGEHEAAATTSALVIRGDSFDEPQGLSELTLALKMDPAMLYQ